MNPLPLALPADPGLTLLTAVLLSATLLLMLLTLSLLVSLRRILGVARPARPADTRTWWQRMAGLHVLAHEKDLVMEHAYDGIHELDNPTPPWFMGLFYSTIGFAAAYLLVFHVLGIGQSQLAEYTQEVAVAEAMREEYIRRVAGSINENTVQLVKDDKSLAAGKTLFAQSCTACHGQHAEGGVGPNLTDAYWLHGGSVKAVYHTIAEGVPDKGMMAWKKQLNPLQMQQVASYILSLQGTNPAGAKEPQGTKDITATARPGAVAAR